MAKLSFLFALPLALATTVVDAQQFPVNIEHAYGSTTIEAQPQRVVGGWGNEDAAIALGTVPVGIPFQSYGGGIMACSPESSRL